MAPRAYWTQDGILWDFDPDYPFHLDLAWAPEGSRVEHMVGACLPRGLVEQCHGQLVAVA